MQIVKEKIGEQGLANLFQYEKEVKTKLAVLKSIAAKEVKCLESIPLELRFDYDILDTAIEVGLFHDKDSVLSFIKEQEGLYIEQEWVVEFHDMLHDHLQKDEAVALAFLLRLDCSYELATSFLSKIPSLTKSEEAMLAIWRTDDASHLLANDPPEEFLTKCPSTFYVDRDFMLSAVNANESNIVLATQLLSDREFMLAVSESEFGHATFITFATPEFQLSNLDIVEKAIGNIRVSTTCHEWFFRTVAPGVWEDRSVVMTWLIEKHPFLCLLKEVYPESSFLMIAKLCLGQFSAVDLN